MAKVSIIVPVYNTEKYLSKCLDSLVNQTLEDIEILIINDGSPDNSQVIIDSYQNKYPHIIKSISKENGGIGSVRNRGIKEVTGEYLAFLDSDDYVEKDTYEKLYKKAKEIDAKMLSCDFIYEYENKKEIFREKRFNNINSAISNIHCVLWNRLYKTEFIRSLNFEFIHLKRYEDANYLYKLVTKLSDNDFYHLDDALIHYVQRPSSWMHSYNCNVLEASKMIDDVIAYYKQNNLYEKYESELEYITIRNCFGQPFRTAVKIKDKKLRKEILHELYSRAFKMFPNWPKNKYINQDSKRIYYKSINHLTYPIYCLIFKYL